jgi:hypothetical protein
MAFLSKRNMHLVRIQAEILKRGGALILAQHPPCWCSLASHHPANALPQG